MQTPDRDLEIGATVLNLMNETPIHLQLLKAAGNAKAALAADPSQIAAAVVLARDIFGPQLPPELKSCRLSVMRGGTPYHIERHPNAAQYVLSLDGGGTIRVKSGPQWIAAHLSSGLSDPLSARWHTVPANTWHQPIPGLGDWTVVSFHTVLASGLEDDYGYQR